jgi:ABC-2 type transport system permease protein
VTTLQKNAKAAPEPIKAAGSRGAWPLRYHVIKAVFDRNFQAYFSNPAGYVFITLFVLVGAAAAFWLPEFFANNLANLNSLNNWMPYLLLFFIPAITMSAWAEERRQGTDELLLTLPAYDIEIVLGKYFAALGIYTVALLFSLIDVLILEWLGSPDLGIIASTFIGYWMMGVLMIAIGLVASLLSSNVTVGFILGAVFCAVPVMLSLLGPLFGSQTRRTIEDLSIPYQFRDFGTGVIPLSAVLYFVTLAGAMLYLNMILIGRRHWAGGERSTVLGFHSLVRVICLLVALIGFDALVTHAGVRFDNTDGHIYTLSEESKTILDQIPSDRPVYIQAYYSPEVPRDYVVAKTNLLALLREYAAIGGDRIRLNLVETELYSPAARKAQKDFGIEPKRVPTNDPSQQSTTEIFLGVAFTSGTEEVVVPFFDPGLPTEYELTRSIRVVSKSGRKKVGILATDAKMMGGFDFRSMGQEQEWPFITELKKQYDVSAVALDAPIPTNLDVLLVAQPSSMTQKQIDTLTDYVRQGHPTLLFHDPLPAVKLDIAPEIPKAPPGGQFGGGPPPEPKGSMLGLLDLLGIDSPGNEIVWNRYNPLVGMPDIFPEYVFVAEGSGGDTAFNPSESATSGLQQVVLMFGGLIRSKASKPDFVPLLQVGGKVGSVGGTLPFNEVIEMNMMGQPGGLNPRRRFVASNLEYTMAALISGKPLAELPKLPDPIKPNEPPPEPTKQADVKVILITDLDLISEMFFDLRKRKVENLDFDNVTFVLNCVDVLAGDEAYIPLRKRRASHRTLTRMEQQSSIFIAKSQKETIQAEEDAKAALEKAQKSLDDRVAAIQNNKELDEQSRRLQVMNAQRVESRRLEVEKSAIEDERRQKTQDSKAAMQQSIREIQSQVRLGAVIAAPLPALLLAIIVFGIRAGRENQGANPNRLARSTTPSSGKSS